MPSKARLFSWVQRRWLLALASSGLRVRVPRYGGGELKERQTDER